MRSPVKVNLSFDIPFDEQRRICMEFLTNRFGLNELWENGKIIREIYYNDDRVFKDVVGEVTEEMKKAKAVYEQLQRDIS